MKVMQPRQIAEFVGVAAVVASLIFVGLEVRHAQNVAISDYESAILQNSVEIADLINQHPIVWEKGRSGAELDIRETVIFENLVRVHTLRAFFTRAQMLRIGHPSSDAPIREFAGLLFMYPGIRAEWERQMADLEASRRPIGMIGTLDTPFADTLNGYLTTLDNSLDN